MDDYLDPIQQFAYGCAIESFMADSIEFEPAEEGTLAEFGKKVWAMIERVCDAIVALVRRAASAIKAKLQAGKEFMISKATMAAFNAVLGLDLAIASVSQMTSRFEDALKEGADNVKDRIEEDIEKVQELNSKIKEQGSKIAEALKSGAESAKEDAVKVTSDAVAGIHSKLNDVAERAEKLKRRVAALRNSAQSKAANISNEARAGVNRMIGLISDSVATINRIVSQLMGAMSHLGAPKPEGLPAAT